jgi:imidazolonepropionase-like amidohydrolase
MPKPWMRSTAWILAATCAAGLSACAPEVVAPAARPDLLLTHATIIDVATGRLIPDQAIAIRGNTIASVGSPAAVMSATDVVDVSGAYVMPGLWDMHVHFGGGAALIDENQDLLPLYVAHGITAIRDAAGDLSPSVLAWRDAVATGALQGPTLFTSGPKLEGIDSVWPGDLEVGNEAEVRAGLDSLQGMRVDFVKITDNTLSPGLFMFALREARRRGFMTSAHVPAALTLDQVSEAGLGSIEHMSYLLRGGSPREAEISASVAAGAMSPADATTALVDTFDPAVAIATYRRLASRGTSVVPTLNGSRVLAYLDRDAHAGDAYLQYLGPGLKATYQGRVERAAKDDPTAVARRHARYEKSVTLLPLLQQAGVRIIAGTDAGFLNSFNYPGIGLHDELEIFVNAGLTPLQALQSATLAGPAFLGKSDAYGAVAAGRVADLIILDRNPLEDIRATRSIRGVVLHGRHLGRADLDSLLEAARARVQEREGAIEQPRPSP